MAEEGGHGPAVVTTGLSGGQGGDGHAGHGQDGHQPKQNSLTREDTIPMSPKVYTPNPFSRQQTSLDIDDYFVSGTIPAKAE